MNCIDNFFNKKYSNIFFTIENKYKGALLWTGALIVVLPPASAAFVWKKQTKIGRNENYFFQTNAALTGVLTNFCLIGMIFFFSVQ